MSLKEVELCNELKKKDITVAVSTNTKTKKSIVQVLIPTLYIPIYIGLYIYIGIYIVLYT